MREEAIFHEALACDPADRAAYLDRACPDPAARAAIEALLRANVGASGFLSHHAPEQTVDLPSAPERPGAVIGAYKLLEQIGEGGFGVVFLAEQAEPVRRKVAVKVLKPGMDTRQVVARFEAERQALAIMDHPHIARVFDGGATDAGRPYFVMELVKGVPITDYCDDHKLEPRQRLELFMTVCHAVQHAHQKGIIHRDLKPSNVLVVRHDTTPVVKVIDFGVAKAFGQALTDKTLFTGVAQMIGTPLYMSPEQAGMSDLDVDTRSDIYSLGVLLYELLTGTTPFEKERFKKAAYDEIRRIIREEEPPKPSTRLSDSTASLPSVAAQRRTEPAKLSKLVRGELDWIVMKALEKDRGRRYETANGFAADVLRYLADEPVQACPPSAAYRVRKFTRRNRQALAVAAVLAVALVVAVGAVAGSIGWATRDRAARQAAVGQEADSALREADQLLKQEKWSEALSAVRRAEGLLAGSDGDDRPERVRRLRTDLETVLRLDEIRLSAGDWQENRFQNERADREYAKAFADGGIDVLGLAKEEVAARIQDRPAIAVALIVALDDWSTVRFHRKDEVGALALIGVAQASDQNRWRREVREVCRDDGARLAALADAPDLLDQPPASIHVFTRFLQAKGQREARLKVLRRAQRQYPGDFWFNYDLGSLLSDKGVASYDEAISFYRAALAVRPLNPAVHTDFGVALDRKGDLTAAVFSYRKAIELDPKHAPAHGNIGWVLVRQNRPDEAISWLRKAIELDPGFANAHNSLGIALKETGQYEAAVAEYKTAIALDPKYSAPHINLGGLLGRQKKYDAALASYRKALELDPKHRDAHVGLGNLSHVRSKPDEALVWFRKALDIDPKYAYAHHGVGVALEAKGKFEEAIDCFKTAMALDPKYSDPHRSLGNVFRKQGTLDDAVASYRKAVEINPKDYQAYTHLGDVLKRQNQLGEAVAAFRKAVELNPGHGYAHSQLWQTLRQKGAADEAIVACQNALKHSAQFARSEPRVLARLQHDLCELLQEAGRHPEAAALFDQSRAVWEKLAEDKGTLSRWELAWFLVTWPDPARRDATRAIELGEQLVKDAPNVFNWRVLGAAHLRAGDWPAAIAALQKANDASKTAGAWEWFFLAMAHWEGGDKDEARRWYDRATKHLEWCRSRMDIYEIVQFQAEARKTLGIKTAPPEVAPPPREAK
jgi:tetratricopeptide (TPR) repeat protein